MPKLDGRGGKHRVKGPHETEEFCALWEAKRAAGEIPQNMTGHRDGYARAFTWGRQAERERWTHTLSTYLTLVDAAWAEACAAAASQGITSVEIGPAQAAELTLLAALREHIK